MNSWPISARAQIEAMLTSRAEGPQFAVFDADNTLWENDLEEALMPWLENHGFLSLPTISDAIKPIPPQENESLWNYYQRLCALDDSIGYLWICQVFDGLRLDVLREAIHDLLASPKPIKTTILDDGEVRSIDVPPPRVFTGQVELIRALSESGVDVWVVSAALEELVRMVAADPKFGLNIPAERVIGVSLLLRNPDGSLRISAHDREHLTGVDAYFAPERLKAQFTHHLYAPATWYHGKVAAIRKWIHPTQPPVLVAGDSANDLPMLFEVDPSAGGIRLFVHRKSKYHQAAQTEAIRRGEALNAEAGWLIVTPKQLHGER